MVKFYGELKMVVHSLSGPKLFYRIQGDDKKYAAVLDNVRDVIVTVYDEDTGEAVYVHELARQGMERMKTMNSAGIEFGVCYLPDLN